jgi:hypothetical protein
MLLIDRLGAHPFRRESYPAGRRRSPPWQRRPPYGPSETGLLRQLLRQADVGIPLPLGHSNSLSHNFTSENLVTLVMPDVALNDRPSRHCLGPRDMPFEANRFRHVAVAIPKLRISRGAAARPRQEGPQPQQPDLAHS